MIAWRKSSFSDGNTNCVELALLPEQVLVRDSKNPAAPNLAFPSVHWHRGLSVFKTHKPTG